MSAFFLFQNLGVVDARTFDEYKRLVPATVENYGGRYRVRGGIVEPVEGPFSLTAPVMIEFPSLAAARRWYGSDEYRALKAMRLRAVRSTGVLVEGL
jgi:uncharacterized protein (DUF1330 family)